MGKSEFLRSKELKHFNGLPKIWQKNVRYVFLCQIKFDKNQSSWGY